MKKINFSDKYGLTEAVLSGRKTQTRRMIPIDLYNACDWSEKNPMFEDSNGDWHPFYESKYVYKVGEVVAVAQSYKYIVERIAKKGYDAAKWMDEHRITKNLAGWLNKMFVKASLMIFKIRITNVCVERLQDISDEDCIKEGIVETCVSNNWGNSASHWEYHIPYEDSLGRTKLLRGLSPQETYAVLIDRISGNGTWESNPWVFVYDFELVK